MSEVDKRDHPSQTLTHQALEALFGLASGVCQEIKAFQPNLLVSLAHSDIGPLKAAQVYWQKTTPGITPFPSLIRINFGVEKERVYERWRLDHGLNGYNRQVSSRVDGYHYQAWMSQNEQYQAEFRHMLYAVLPEEAIIKRVLILDEISHGATREIAFALLYGLYPQAELRFIAGVQDWTNALGEAWLHATYPALWADLQSQKTEKSMRRRFPTDLHEPLKQIVVGTEDLDRDSLHWRPIQATNPAVQTLVAQGIAMPDCLSCAGWVQAQIEKYISARLAGTQQPTECSDNTSPYFKTWPFPAEDRVWMEIWIKDGVSLARWAKICGISREQAKKAILNTWQYHQELEPAGFGAATRYRVNPGYLPEPPEDEAPTRSHFMRLADGQILAHSYPENNFIVDRLLAERVEVIINLTTTPGAPPDQHHWPNRNPDWFHSDYRENFLQKAANTGLQVTIHNYPIQPYSVPSVAQVIQILDVIDAAVSAGKKVSVHDRAGNERTGLVLGCYLVRHGMPGKRAVKLLNQQLAQTYIAAYRTPGTEAQYRFILRWPVGQ